MKRRMNFRPVLLAAALLIFVNGEAQVTIQQNNPSTPNTEYVGWDATTQEALEIRQDHPDWPIEFYTTGDNISEMWLTPTLQNFVFNTYTLDLSGNLGVGPGFSDAIPPLSRLHLNAEPMLSVNSYTLGYRDWMRTGMLATEGRDGMYVGLKNEGSAIKNPAIINWSSNIGAGGRDPLRFIFTSSPGGAGEAATDEGLEFARLYPHGNGNDGYFGIGNFNVAGFQPDERLDVLNGGVKIRDLPTAPYNDDDLERIVVVDQLFNIC